MQASNVKTKVGIPSDIKEKLSDKSIEQQLKYFCLERCHKTTFWIDQKIQNKEKYKGEKVEFAEKYTIIVQDGIIVGLDIGEELYCFSKPCSSIRSYGGHRTSNDGWGYEEEHEWYIFRYIGEPKKTESSEKRDN